MSKIESQKKAKDTQIFKEGKLIMKKEREARMLEVLEAEVLQRLRDTHLKQQQALDEIQQIFKQRDQTSFKHAFQRYRDPLSDTQGSPERQPAHQLLSSTGVNPNEMEITGYEQNFPQLRNSMISEEPAQGD